MAKGKSGDGVSTAISVALVGAVVYVVWANWDSLAGMFNVKLPGIGQKAVPAGNYVKATGTVNRLDTAPPVSPFTNPDLSINNGALGIRALSNIRTLRFAQ